MDGAVGVAAQAGFIHSASRVESWKEDNECGGELEVISALLSFGVVAPRLQLLTENFMLNVFCRSLAWDSWFGEQVECDCEVDAVGVIDVEGW